MADLDLDVDLCWCRKPVDLCADAGGCEWSQEIDRLLTDRAFIAGQRDETLAELSRTRQATVAEALRVGEEIARIKADATSLRRKLADESAESFFLRHELEQTRAAARTLVAEWEQTIETHAGTPLGEEWVWCLRENLPALRTLAALDGTGDRS